MNKLVHIPALEVFLISLDAFDKVQEKLDLTRNEYKQFNITKDGHLGKFEYIRGRIVNWLVDEKNKNDEFAYMKVPSI